MPCPCRPWRECGTSVAEIVDGGDDGGHQQADQRCRHDQACPALRLGFRIRLRRHVLRDEVGRQLMALVMARAGAWRRRRTRGGRGGAWQAARRCRDRRRGPTWRGSCRRCRRGRPRCCHHRSWRRHGGPSGAPRQHAVAFVLHRQTRWGPLGGRLAMPLPARIGPQSYHARQPA